MARFCVQSFLCTSCHMSLTSNLHTFLLSFSSGKTSDLFLDLFDVQRSDLCHHTNHDQIVLQQLILFLDQYFFKYDPWFTGNDPCIKSNLSSFHYLHYCWWWKNQTPSLQGLCELWTHREYSHLKCCCFQWNLRAMLLYIYCTEALEAMT